MDAIEKKARSLRELIDQYWSLAYAEGREGRTHDTEAGDAQRVSLEIDSAIRDISSITLPEGYVLVPVVPTPEMKEAGIRERMKSPANINPCVEWPAMLAARPEVPNGGG